MFFKAPCYTKSAGYRIQNKCIKKLKGQRLVVLIEISAFWLDKVSFVLIVVNVQSHFSPRPLKVLT